MNNNKKYKNEIDILSQLQDKKKSKIVLVVPLESKNLDKDCNEKKNYINKISYSFKVFKQNPRKGIFNFPFSSNFFCENNPNSLYLKNEQTEHINKYNSTNNSTINIENKNEILNEFFPKNYITPFIIDLLK
jgi:hypothetical protein